MIEIQKCYAVNGTKQEILNETFPTFNDETELGVYRKKLTTRERLKHPYTVMVNGEERTRYEKVEIFFVKRDK